MTTLGENRDEALRAGYEAADWPMEIPFDVYTAVLQPWRVQSIERDGKCIGALYRNDESGEVHAAILPEHRRRWATRGLLREIFSAPNVNTSVSAGHEFMYGILGRLGFEKADDGQLYMRKRKWV